MQTLIRFLLLLALPIMAAESQFFFITIDTSGVASLVMVADGGEMNIETAPSDEEFYFLLKDENGGVLYKDVCVYPEETREAFTEAGPKRFVPPTRQLVLQAPTFEQATSIEIIRKNGEVIHAIDLY